MSNKAKELRGQLRQIVKEVLPEILTKELFEKLDLQVKKRLDEIDKRQKEITSFIVRNSVK